MATCRLCAWLCGDMEQWHASLWDSSNAWEREHSNEAEQWSEETDGNLALIRQAEAIEDTDPEAAFRLLLEAAEDGSIWAVQLVGWHYDAGVGVAVGVRQAMEYYCRAISAGSWMATIGYAQLLAKHGHLDLCEEVLEGGVRAVFLPAFYWLAWFRYQRSPTRKTARQIRPMLERVAREGHPRAELMICTLMRRGKFGLCDRFAAIRRTVLLLERFPPEPQAGAGDVQRVVLPAIAHQ